MNWNINNTHTHKELMCQKKRGLFVRPERTEHAVKLATSSPSFGNRVGKNGDCKILLLVILAKLPH